jgi:hypothetical protein
MREVLWCKCFVRFYLFVVVFTMMQIIYSNFSTLYTVLTLHLTNIFRFRAGKKIQVAGRIV